MTVDKEKEHSRKLAGWILDQPHVDPDGNEAVLARQLLRADEEINRLRAVVEAAEKLRAITPGYWGEALNIDENGDPLKSLLADALAAYDTERNK